MTSPNLRSTQAALDVARPLIVRLDERRHPEDVAADLIEGWAAVETALRAMIGGSSLGGQALVSDVRAQGRLDYPHAHALLGFLAARDRATRPDYQPTTEDVAAARAGFQAIEAANGSGIAANTGVHPSVAQGAILPPPVPPREVRRGAGPAGANGAPLAPYPPAVRDAGQEGGRYDANRYDAGRATGGRDADPLPPLEDGRTPPRRGLSPALIIGLGLLLLLVVGGAGAYLLGRGRGTSGPLDEGVAAYSAGRKEAARAAFERAAAADAAASMPRVYLARLARESGDLVRATAYLDTAIRIDTTNPVAFREMGQLQLQAERPQLAASFFRRAIERDPNDRVAQGWLACALTRVGNVEVAERFYARAGAGDWTACRQSAGSVGAPNGFGPPGGPPVGAPVGAPGAGSPGTP